MEQTLRELPVKWGWLLALGVLFILGGTFGIMSAFLLTIVSVILFGALALAAGIAQLWHGIVGDAAGWSGRAAHLLVAVAYLLVGGLLLWDPVSGSVSLTLVLAAFLVAIGLTRLYYAWQCRSRGWRWRLVGLGGLIDLVLAGLILYGWPGTGLWVIGLFVAIEMIVSGWILVAVAFAARRHQAAG
jgi:uncharacterized membrane protein HdeD (DUF308 family)